VPRLQLAGAIGQTTVLITGGLTGIGRASAVTFAKKGVVAGRRDELGKAPAEELRTEGFDTLDLKDAGVMQFISMQFVTSVTLRQKCRDINDVTSVTAVTSRSQDGSE
jgi:NAD(P)-dependent dehydrogenase (short-subunit alcohol dehydrogenase family)